MITPAKLPRPLAACLGLLLCASAAAAAAQTSPSSPPPPSQASPAAAMPDQPPAAQPPRVGVVLSGGSAKGLAHIGVLRVLEEAGVRVDVVTGTSMGSLVGGLYAIGYTPNELSDLVTGLDWPAMFRDAPPRRFAGLERRLTGPRSLLNFPITHGRLGLPGGVIGGQRISMLLAEFTWPVQTERDFRRFPIPFAAVATDIETGQAVRLDTGSVAEVMRASMSLPSVFEPVRLQGRLLVDGGIARNLPAQDARDLGANVVICSDVSGPLYQADSLRSFVDILVQSISFEMNTSTLEQRKLCDVLILPNQAGLSTASFDRAGEWIARGDTAARAVLPQLRAIAARAPRHDSGERSSVLNALERRVRVDSVEVLGVGGSRERLLRRIAAPIQRDSVSRMALQEVVERGFGTGQFQRVGYQITASGADTVLHISAAPETRDRLGFGFRYDDRYRASLLFTARFRNWVRFGSSTTFDARLGEQTRFGARHLEVNPLGFPFTFQAEVAHTRTPLDFYDGGKRVAIANSRVTEINGFAGVALTASATAGVQVKLEHASASTAVASADTSQRRTYPSAAFVIWRDALDRPDFPTRGVAFAGRSEWAFGADAFSQQVAEARVVVPLGGRLSGSLQANAGFNRGGDRVPLHYRFFLGGAYPGAVYRERQVPLAGLAFQARTGQALARGSAALQWELRRDVFATLRGDVGGVSEELGDVLGDPVGGVALSLGARTPFGPLELTASTASPRRAPRMEFTLGYAF
ncbi:MAG TPA: patatin-like phospholipase family protein [Longimicrobium sp.]|nr:patatin-like phospholipase family protein [Longimicrobium sp.]